MCESTGSVNYCFCFVSENKKKTNTRPNMVLTCAIIEISWWRRDVKFLQGGSWWQRKTLFSAVFVVISKVGAGMWKTFKTELNPPHNKSSLKIALTCFNCQAIPEYLAVLSQLICIPSCVHCNWSWDESHKKRNHLLCVAQIYDDPD